MKTVLVLQQLCSQTNAHIHSPLFLIETRYIKRQYIKHAASVLIFGCSYPCATNENRYSNILAQFAVQAKE